MHSTATPPNWPRDLLIERTRPPRILRLHMPVRSPHFIYAGGIFEEAVRDGRLSRDGLGPDQSIASLAGGDYVLVFEHDHVLLIGFVEGVATPRARPVPTQDDQEQAFGRIALHAGEGTRGHFDRNKKGLFVEVDFTDMSDWSRETRLKLLSGFMLNMTMPWGHRPDGTPCAPVGWQRKDPVVIGL